MFNVTSNIYDTASQLVRTETSSAGGVHAATLYTYDSLGEPLLTCEDLNLNGTIDLAGPDRVTGRSSRYVQLSGDWWHESASWTYPANGSAAPLTNAVSRTRLTGLGGAYSADGATGTLTAESVSVDARGNATTSRIVTDRDNKTVYQLTYTPGSTVAALSTTVNGLLVSSRSTSGLVTTYAYDAMTRLFFVSHRTGRPEIWCELRGTGELQQLTDQPDLGEWSVHPSHDGRHVYYVAGSVACRVACADGTVDRLLDFGPLAGREPGMVGASMGTTTLSHDDRYWAVPAKIGAKFHFIVIDTATGAHETILEADTIGHPEFHPSENTLLRYAGSYKQRIWVINRDGTGNRLVYDRKPLATPGQFEWIVHETWNPAKPREIITANWPRGCIGIDIDTGATRPVCSFNAWHPSINRQGTLMCADTTFPDIGLQLFDPRDGSGQPRPLCFPEATNEGKHWNTDHCPYDDADYRQGKWKVYAPQHTHPHPAFSPDGRFVVFTSDRTGHSQVYEVELEARRD